MDEPGKCTHQSEVKNLAYEAYGIMREGWGYWSDTSTLDGCSPKLQECWHAVAQHIMKLVRNWDSQDKQPGEAVEPVSNGPDLAAQLAAKDKEIAVLNELLLQEKKLREGAERNERNALIVIEQTHAVLSKQIVPLLYPGARLSEIDRDNRIARNPFRVPVNGPLKESP